MVRFRFREGVIHRVVVVVLLVLAVVVVLSFLTINQEWHQNGVDDITDKTELEQEFAKEASRHLFLDGNYRIAIDTSDDVFDTQHAVPLKKPPTIEKHAFESTDIEETGYNSLYNENEREEKIDWNLDPVSKDPSRYHICDKNSPVKNIILLKTHRTGTGTFSNILYRYGDLNNLMFALPSRKTFDSFWPVKFHSSFLDQKTVNFTKPHLLVNARFNYGTMTSLMPKDSQIIAILRNPIEQLESAFFGMEIDLLLGLENATDPFAEFLSSPKQHVMDYIMRENKFHFDLNFIKNGMFFDLGLEHGRYSNPEEIQIKIKELAGRLDLVLIMDYFDESLVLMKREFCWELDDVIHFKFNQRSRELKRRDFNESLKEQALQWNKADHELFKHFNKTFWERVNDLGPGFYKEVHELRERVIDIEKECLDLRAETWQAIEDESSSDSPPEFILKTNISAENQYFCEKMVRTEKDYVSYLKEKTMLTLQKTNSQVVKEFLARTVSSTLSGNSSASEIQNETLEETQIVWDKR